MKPTTLFKKLTAAVATSAALTMTALADLPPGYRQLDYIDTDGTQWVNTQFTPESTDKVEAKVRLTARAPQFLWCSRSGTSNGTTFSLYLNQRNYDQTKLSFRFDCGAGGTTSDTDNDLNIGTDYILVEDADARKFYIKDGTGADIVSGDTPSATLSTVGPFALFGSHSAGSGLNSSTAVSNKAYVRFYWFKVFASGGSLKCHIVPVYGENEAAVGLYDLVAGRFLPAYGETLVGHYTHTLTLTEDKDWSYSPENRILAGSNVLVDLNGHNLSAAMSLVATNSISSANADYQDLEYISSTGEQMIKITDFLLPGTAKVEMKVRMGPTSATQGLFMSRAGALEQTYTCIMYGTNTVGKAGKLRFSFNDSHNEGSTVLSDESDSVLVFDGSVPSWSVDGIAQTTPSGASEFTGGGDLILFNMGQNGLYYPATYSLYYFTVTTNDVALLDLRPVRRISDGVVGLYDRVGDVFYTSSLAAFPQFDGIRSQFTNSCEAASELCVGQELMPGYTVVECITATNRGTRIDTGYVPQSTDRLEMRASIKIEGNDNTDFLFCSRVGSKNKTFTVLHSGTSHKLRFDFNATQWISDYVVEDNTPITVALDGNTGSCYVNGETLDMGSTSFNKNFTPSATLLLFSKQENGANFDYHPTGNIYWFKAVGADGKLKLDMVPVVRNSDSVAGLYDRVNRRFYSSATSKPFAAGSQVGDGKLYVDLDCSFVGSEVMGNITFVKKGEGAFDGGGLSLASTLKPEAGTIRGVTLSNGATLDLSGRADAFSLNDNAISFANGARITIALGSREIRSGTKLISWTTAPSNIGTLTFLNGETGRKLLVKEDGVYPAPKGLIMIVR